MNFTTAQKVKDTIDASQQVEMTRGENRSKINDMANGKPPLDAEAAKKSNVKINVNWGEMATLFAHARRQYTNAFYRPAVFFKVNIPLAPPEKALQWGLFITQFINRVLKRSKSYFYLGQHKFSSVVAHGIGPQIWHNQDDWLAKYVALEDLRVPTDTEVSMDNTEWFAERVRYTEGTLTDKVFGQYSSRGWKKDDVKKLLDNSKDKNYENNGYTWLTAPEKMAELVKQNLGYYSSDAVPTIPLWHFYYQDRDDKRNKTWKMKVVPTDDAYPAGDKVDFLYTSEKPIATDLGRILQIQFGDLNNKAPFLYHSVRSLGFLLMEPCFWTNLARCRGLQHMMESFNVWLRSTDPNGRARAQKVEMFDRAFLPEGISIVPQNERHQINPQMFEMMMAQLKQLMNEASASYTQQADTGTQKEQTAYETSVKLAQVNAMMSGLLTTAFFLETGSYVEICRRFCRKNSTNPDVQEFQKKCRAAGIPPIWLNVDYWDVEPEIPLGAGSPTMAMSEATQLMANREKYDPTAQQEILHDFTAVVTSNPLKADRLVPLDGNRGVTDAQRDAEFAFATLMCGVPVRMKEGLSPIDQIETLMGLLSGVIARIEQQDNLGTANEILGLQTVAQYVQQLIQQLGQNEQERPRAKQYSQMLGKLMNSVKGFEQRLAEQNKRSQVDPETQAKVETVKMLADVKAHTSAHSAAQKSHLKDRAFEAEQLRKDAQAAAELQRQNLKAGHEVGVEHAKAGHEMQRESAKAANEIENENARAEAETKRAAKAVAGEN